MQHRLLTSARIALLTAACPSLVCGIGAAQAPAPVPPAATQISHDSAPAMQNSPASTRPSQMLPESPYAPALLQRPQLTPKEKEAARIAALTHINGRPYDRPSHKDQFDDYLRDSYGWPAFARSTARALYSEARGGPSGWGQDFPGFSQRFGSNVAITAIDGNVRFAMETVFREDMRYIPCHGCSVKRKIANVFLAEVTARHDADGHRFFTLTPAIADFSGPIIANTFWYPNHDPFGGVVGTRTVAAARVGQHLFTEFVWERRHHDPKLGDESRRPKANVASAAVTSH